MIKGEGGIGSHNLGDLFQLGILPEAICRSDEHLPVELALEHRIAEAVAEAADVAQKTARKTSAATKRTARQARKVPGVAQAEGQVKGAVASEDDLAIAILAKRFRVSEAAMRVRLSTLGESE